MTDKTVPQVQYRLHGYVCGNACFSEPDVEGSVSLPMIYVKRPQHCRYAIVSAYDARQHCWDVLVWDLFEVTESLKTGTLITPTPVRRCVTVAQAIAATFLLYRND